MRIVPLSQGIFYIASGLWPIVGMRSFEAVTGKKHDRWLVQAMGGLIAAVGTALVVGARERRSRTVATLGAVSAMTLGGTSAYFAARGRISPVYLADAAVEVFWLGAWLAAD